MDKNEFTRRLKELKLNNKEFSKISNIPYSTVTGWGCLANNKILPIPVWVEPFLEYYEKSIKLDYVATEICAKMQDFKV
ncbi:MAG: hypothetical protein WBG69_09320 [Arcobacteraceae bacterium]